MFVYEWLYRQASHPFYRLVITLVLFTLLGFLSSNVCLAQDLSQPTRVVINVPSRTLSVFAGDEKIQEYAVGVGQAQFPTPIGQFQVISKVKDPIWEDPFKPQGKSRHSYGPLGTRWIGFKAANGGEYGIHGTNQPQSIGKFSTHGCVRMTIQQAEELYDMVKMGTPVEVTYDLIAFQKEAGELKLQVFPDWFKFGKKPTVWQVHKRIQSDYPRAKVDSEKVHWALLTHTAEPVVIGKVTPAIRARITN